MKSEIFEDNENAKPGYYYKFYRSEIKEVYNKFGIKL